MDFWGAVMDGMPHDMGEETDAIIACENMAHALWQFYSACRKQGFKEDFAYGLTLTYFEGMWNTDIEADADDGDRKDDCK